MKKKLISTLLCAILSFTFLGTSIPASAIEKNRSLNNLKQNENDTEDEDSYSYGNTELTDEDYKWMEENMEDETASTYDEVYGENAVKKRVREAFFQTSTTAPKSKDLSEKNWFPKIGDQGGIGSCAAFAAVYYQMSYAVNKQLNNGETLTFSPKWIYNITNDGQDCGSNVIENFRAIKKYGVLTLKEYPYDGSSINSKEYTSWSTKSEDWLKAQKYSIDSFAELNIFKNSNNVYDYDTANIESIKAKINEDNILNISIFARSDKYSTIKGLDSAKNKDDYSSDTVSNKYKNEKIVQYADNTYDGSHAVTIVGYDDTIWTDINKDDNIQPEELGAFKIANSWSEKSDNKGFFWVSYDAFNRVSKVPVKENAKAEECAYKNSRNAFSPNGTLTWIKSPKILEKTPSIYAKFTLNTNMRHECNVKLSAKNINTNEVTTYSDFDPFKDNTYGYLSFDGSFEKNDGSFAIDLSRVIPNINSDSLNSYIWTLSVKDDEDDDNCLLVKDFKIIDKNKNKEYSRSFNIGLSLDNTSTDININPNEPAVSIASVCSNSSDKIFLNQVINIYCNAFYGNNNTYKFKIVNDLTGDEEEFDAGTKNNIDWYPKKAGSYTIYVTVKDSYGNSDSNENIPLTILVDEALKPVSALSDLSYTINNNLVNLKWNIDDKDNIKRYDIYRNGKFIGSTTSQSYTDTKEANAVAYKYTIKAITKDELVASKDIDVAFKDNCINLYFEGDSSNKTITVGDTVFYTINSAGGNGNVNYSCEVINEDDLDNTINISPIPGTNTYAFTAKTAGKYYMSFMASDSKNNTSNNLYPRIIVKDKSKVQPSDDKTFNLKSLTFKEDTSEDAINNLILKWDEPKESVNIKKYKIYLNDELIAETNERIFRTIAHKKDQNKYDYHVVAVDDYDNVLATSKSYIIDPAPYGVFVTTDKDSLMKDGEITLNANDPISFNINTYGSVSNVTYNYSVFPNTKNAKLTWDGFSPSATFSAEDKDNYLISIEVTYNTKDSSELKSFKTDYLINVNN